MKLENDDIDLGTGDEAEIVPLEEKYAEQMRQIFPQKIELPISTLSNMVADQIELNPNFQRRDVWDRRKQSKFIESLIMNVPIPPVFMGEDKYSKYVVLDGRQRLTAIVKYLKNEYELVGLDVWSELNGKRFSDLAAMELDVTITRRFLPAVVLLKESSPEVKYDVFERLNTGGLNLNPMEIRNAVYRGPFTELLHHCADHKSFRLLWGIPESDQDRKKNKTYARMVDLELVLRFFALGHAQEQTEASRPAFKTYLGIFMKEQNDLLTKDPSLVEKEYARFSGAISNCLELLGEDAFRPVNKKDRSAPFADALMYGLADLDLKGEAEKKVAAQGAVTDLQATNQVFQDAMASGTNGKAKIETRLREARKAIIEAIEAVD
jgi:Protein of unknown function DUF262